MFCHYKQWQKPPRHQKNCERNEYYTQVARKVRGDLNFYKYWFSIFSIMTIKSLKIEKTWIKLSNFKVDLPRSYSCLHNPFLPAPKYTSSNPWAPHFSSSRGCLNWNTSKAVPLLKMEPELLVSKEHWTSLVMVQHRSTSTHGCWRDGPYRGGTSRKTCFITNKTNMIICIARWKNVDLQNFSLGRA